MLVPVICYVSIQIFYQGRNNSWQGELRGNQIKVVDNSVILVDFSEELDKMGYELMQAKAVEIKDNYCKYLKPYEKYKDTRGLSTLEQAMNYVKSKLGE